VKERLRVLMAEEKEYMGQSSGQPQPKSAGTSQQKTSQSN